METIWALTSLSPPPFPCLQKGTVPLPTTSKSRCLFSPAEGQLADSQGGCGHQDELSRTGRPVPVPQQRARRRAAADRAGGQLLPA